MTVPETINEPERTSLHLVKLDWEVQWLLAKLSNLAMTLELHRIEACRNGRDMAELDAILAPIRSEFAETLEASGRARIAAFERTRSDAYGEMQLEAWRPLLRHRRP